MINGYFISVVLKSIKKNEKSTNVHFYNNERIMKMIKLYENKNLKFAALGYYYFKNSYEELM